MCSLSNFPPPPESGLVTVCEKDSKMQVMSVSCADVTRFTSLLAAYPAIHITREVLRPTVSKESARAAFLPSEETSLKRAVHAWYERGILAALEELDHEESSAEIHPAISWAANKALALVRWTQKLHGSLYPHLMLPPESLIVEFGRVRDWTSSPVRCISWHPQCTKLAVALRDDSVQVHASHESSSPSSLMRVLKHRRQRGVSCMAWRPFSSSELAVGCQDGILLWHVDPCSLVTRPSSAAVTFLGRNGHMPLSGLAWHPQGTLLVSASAMDTTMYVWEVAMEKSVPLKRVGGGGVSLVAWSMDGFRVFAATPSSVFRVWETQKWSHERWSTVEGNVQAACWSPCGSVLLFATSKDPFIYALVFPWIDMAASPKKETVGRMEEGPWEKGRGVGARAAIPVVDLTLVEFSGGREEPIGIGGVVQDMAWDPSGERLAVMFKETNLIAIFRTRASPSLQISPCGFVQGAPGEAPATIAFQENFKHGALLAVAWSSGRVQYVPLLFSYGTVQVSNGQLLPLSSPLHSPHHQLPQTLNTSSFFLSP